MIEGYYKNKYSKILAKKKHKLKPKKKLKKRKVKKKKLSSAKARQSTSPVKLNKLIRRDVRGVSKERRSVNSGEKSSFYYNSVN